MTVTRPAHAELVVANGVKAKPRLLADDRCTGEHGEVLQHRVAALSERRGFDRHRGEGAAGTVDDQGRQRLRLDVLGNDQERTSRAHDQLEAGQQVGDCRDLGISDQNSRVGQHGLHVLQIGDEMRGDVSAVELHAFDDLDLGVDAGAVLDGDDALLAHLVEGVGNHRADHGVAGADRGHAEDVIAALDGVRARANRRDGRVARRHHAAPQLVGGAPAARFRNPSSSIDLASTVAVVVPSPAMSLVLIATSLSSCAPMFSK